MQHDAAEQMQDIRHRLRVPKGTRLHVRLSQYPDAASRNQELLRLAENDLAREETAAQPTWGPQCTEVVEALLDLAAAGRALTARLRDGLVLPVASHAPVASPSPSLDEADPFEGLEDISALNFRTRDSSSA